MMRALKISFFLMIVANLGTAFAYEKPPYGPGQVRVGEEALREKDFEEIRISENLGAQVALDSLSFVDETGQTQKLSHFFRGKPVVLSLIYFRCPSLCGLLMNGVVASMKRIPLQVGKDYDAIFLSINPEETPELAHDKRENYIRDYLDAKMDRATVESGWRFLTGKEEDIRQLASTVGFGFRKDEKTGEYNHSAGFFVLTPEGVVSRVHFGVQFEPRDVQLSILEAGQGQIGSIVDKIMMFCYRYDPSAKGYALAAMNLVRAGGAVTLALMLFYFGIFWFRQRRLAKVSQRSNRES